MSGTDSNSLVTVSISLPDGRVVRHARVDDAMRGALMYAIETVAAVPGRTLASVCQEISGDRQLHSQLAAGKRKFSAKLVDAWLHGLLPLWPDPDQLALVEEISCIELLKDDLDARQEHLRKRLLSDLGGSESNLSNGVHVDA